VNPTSSRGSGIPALVTIAVAACSLYSLRPPAAVGNAAATEFSASAAMSHIRKIAGVPRPTGSAGNAAAREYIVSAFRQLGVEPEVQETIGLWRERGLASSAAVRNIVARLPGSQHGHAVLLVGHYDSVPTGPGAGDDGQSVGVLLETLRALRAGPPLRNDVMFLLDDGEELDLLGASAFVKEHPMAKDAAVVLNFEGRGTGGPVYMFETSEGNGWLVRQLAAVAPYPRTDSISYEVYRRLPNDTDLTVFKKFGHAGLNFAFIDDVFFYHTPLDDLNHLSPASVQHQGSYALSLAQQFGNADLTSTKAADVVYFTAPFRTVVVYSQNWVWPLTLVTAMVLILLIGGGVRSGQLRAWGMMRGLAACLLMLIVLPASAWGLWKLIALVQPRTSYTVIQPYNWRWYEAAYVLVAMAIAAGIVAAFRRWSSAVELAAAGLVVWLVALIGACVAAPLTSYLFLWPLLLALPAFWAMMSRAGWLTIALCVAGAVAAWMVTPYLDMLLVSLAVSAGWLSMLLLAMMLMLLTPVWGFAASKRLVIASAVGGVTMLAAGYATGGFSPQHPRPATVGYAMEASTGKAAWYTDALTPDVWTDQFIPRESKRAWLPRYVPPMFMRQGPAPAIAAEPPDVEIVSDRMLEKTRMVSLRIKSRRGAQGLIVWASPRVNVHGMAIDGHAFDRDGSAYTFPFELVMFRGLQSEGIELQLEFTDRRPVHLRVLDSSDGLPGEHKPRPADMMRSMVYWPYNESTLVEREFTVPGRE
jgi:hypothetical protein